MMPPLVHGIYGSAAPAFVGAYDAIPNLVHVYEIARRALTSYEGNLVRLRRASDNAELDFGYDANGDLDTAAIATWAGGDSFIVTIYDQKSGDNVTQGTAGNQPLFVASGQNGRAVGRYNGTSHYLQGAFSGALSQPFTVYALAALDAAAVNDNSSRRLIQGDDASNRMALYQASAKSPDEWAIFAGAEIFGGVTDSNCNLWAVLFNGASSQLWINGSSEAAGNAGAENPDGITIAANFNATLFWDGDIAAIAIADPSHDDTERGAMETAVNDYWSIIP
jgi:hypothetical protein